MTSDREPQQEAEDEDHIPKRSVFTSARQESISLQLQDDLSFKMHRMKETKVVNVLGAVVFALLLCTMIFGAIGIYWYGRGEESKRFDATYDTYSHRIMDSFHDAVERRLGSIATMSNAITSHAMASNQQFPFVTIPNFEIRGSDTRLQADALIVHFCPLVNDSMRPSWEAYSLEQRYQIDEAFVQDQIMRDRQDKKYGLWKNTTQRSLQDSNSPSNLTVFSDGTNFHPRIYSHGSLGPVGDEPEGSGPYLPLWQRSPINGARQNQLNLNFANTQVFEGVLDAVLKTRHAILNKAVVVLPNGRDRLKKNLAISQFRHEADQYLNDPITFFAYPVFTSFEEESEIGGVLATNIYWKQLFADILPPDAEGYICVLQNSYNQTLTYRIDGSQAVFIGEGDLHNTNYDVQRVKTSSVNKYLEETARPSKRSYVSIPLSSEIGTYTLSVYPSPDAKESFHTNNPWYLVIILACVFLVTLSLFILFFCFVERRQRIVVDKVLQTAARVAKTERELNEFLAHECRNPLSAALVAQSFIRESIAEQKEKQSIDGSFWETVQEDMNIIGSSLEFIDEFLITMLDMYRAEARQIDVKLVETDLRADVIEPVLSMLSRNNSSVELNLECPNALLIVTDRLRLKQILLNLLRNACKFVQSGFIRCHVYLKDGVLDISVEDSGPGIPWDRRGSLFQKYMTSLHTVGQGNGIGLCLCKSLVQVLDGEIFLDENYDSGVPGSPGARFTVRFDYARIACSSTKDLDVCSANLDLSASANSVTETITCIPSPMESFSGDGRRQKISEVVAAISPETPEGRAVVETGAIGEETKQISTVESTTSGELPQNLSVLFVDDDKILRKLFVRAIKKAVPSWQTTDAESGEAALALANHNTYDLIFMDMYMPSPGEGTDLLGTETIVKLRERGVASTICGLSANSLEEEFITAGADAFLLKPIPCDVTALKAELFQILRSRQKDGEKANV